MSKHYFTFGIVHKHEIGDNVFDGHTVVEIEAPDENIARDIMFKHFGREWAFQYRNLEDVGIELYKNGVVPLPEVSPEMAELIRTQRAWLEARREMFEAIDEYGAAAFNEEAKQVIDSFNGMRRCQAMLNAYITTSDIVGRAMRGGK